MLGVNKQDNAMVHGNQMRPRSCRRTRRKQNAVHPSPSRGRQAHSCRRQFLQATPARLTSDSAAHHAEPGDDLTCGSRRRKRSKNDNMTCCSEKGRFLNSAWFQAEEDGRCSDNDVHGVCGREHHLTKTRMLCVGAALSCPTATCHSAPSVELAHPGLLCKVQDASVEQAVEEPRDREDATNDCAQLHKEVRQLLSRLRVTHGSDVGGPTGD